MSKIIINAHAIDQCQQLHAPLGTLELGQCGNALGRGHAYMPGRRQRRQRVSDTMLTGLRPGRLTLTYAVQPHLKARTIRLQQPRLPLPALPSGLARCPAAHRNHSFKGLFALRVDDQTAGGHSTHQMVKLAFNRRQIWKNIRVIVFKIVQHRRARPVMHKLGALVEERTVVLVRLHNKKWRPAQAGRDPKILRHSTNQETRRHTCVLKNPGQQTRGGGLAVGTRHCEHPALLQNVT